MSNQFYLSRILKTALVGVSLIVSFAAAELLVRYLGIWQNVAFDKRDYFKAAGPEPGIPYLLKTNLKTNWAGGRILSDAQGLRNSFDYPRAHPESYRVVVVGDSLVFGYGVSQNETIPWHLEQFLNRRAKPVEGKKFEVINAGIEGFSAQDEAALLPFVIKHYAPDAIVWLLIGNDWDDSLSVDGDGRMTTALKSYAASSEWLELTWGFSGNCLHFADFSKDMGKEQLAWAKEQQYKPAATIEKTLLLEQSFLYSLLKNRLAWTSKNHQISEDLQLDCFPIRKSSGIQKWPKFPKLDAITLSPIHHTRFLNAVKKGAQAATQANVPLLMLGLGIPVDQLITPEYPKVLADDAVAYLGMDYDQFRAKYNLGWDPHFNSSGNQQLAQVMGNALFRNRLLVADAGATSIAYEDRTAYWNAFNGWQQKFSQEFVFPMIDFEHFKNLHQLVGGLFPPRLFPIKGGAPLSVILKGRNDCALLLSGNNRMSHAQKLELMIANQKRQTIEISPGEFQSIISCSNVETNNNIVDVRLECQEACENIKIHQLGFVSSDEAAALLAQPIKSSVPISSKTGMAPRILDFGPQEIRLGQTFNLQGDGSSAIWVKGEQISADTQILLAGESLPTTVDLKQAIMTALVPHHLLSSAGNLSLQLQDKSSGQSSELRTIKLTK